MNPIQTVRDLLRKMIGREPGSQGDEPVPEGTSRAWLRSAGKLLGVFTWRVKDLESAVLWDGGDKEIYYEARALQSPSSKLYARVDTHLELGRPCDEMSAYVTQSFMMEIRPAFDRLARRLVELRSRERCPGTRSAWAPLSKAYAELEAHLTGKAEPKGGES